MNGPQHFIAAERCLAEAIKKHSPLYMDAALVHAQLALTAATALPNVGDMPVLDCEAWEAAVSISATPGTPIYNALATPAAGPLVTCPATLAEDTVKCQLPIDHDGMHKEDDHETVISWSSSPAAEPLVTCGAEDSDASNHGGPCGLPVDHNGPHDNGAGWAWLDDSHYGDGTRIRQEDLAAIEPEHQADNPSGCSICVETGSPHGMPYSRCTAELRPGLRCAVYAGHGGRHSTERGSEWLDDGQGDEPEHQADEDAPSFVRPYAANL